MEYKIELLLPTLKTLPDVIESYISNIPTDILDNKRNDNTWTVREHIYHIASIQEMLLNRINIINETVNPKIEPFFPDKQIKLSGIYLSIRDAFNVYKTFRDKQVAVLQTLTPNDYNKQARHGEYIQYNIPVIVNHMIFHEYWHMYRIEEIWLTKDEYFQ